MKVENNEEIRKVLNELGIGNVKDEDLDKFSEIYPIVTIGDDRLRKDNEEVEIDDKLIEFIACLVNSLYYWNGCGIAAPQVGRNIRVFAVKVEKMNEDDESEVELPLTIFINPTIIEYGEETDWDYEGCLSVPDFYAMVERSTRIVIQYWDINGEKHVEEFKGFPARAIQHEYDHLDGIIYTDIAEMTTFTTKDNLMNQIDGGNE